ncbi:inactive serine/threonine-protein kinase PLK5 isoform X3 [Arvicanthis niloticus]|uniref:inactive serine/threonine-protein kinase PLK5 isoform X3 n=1 Tax=Arvicanthis niloticus TaxID=61156 RepID=UPI001486459A|nr:inactive serine/threonine-protein kinase PLK5 isoform X3 [Arvicanthis niloticus]
MEPRSRRRRSRQLVATFLRDPGSGRVYRRGKLIGKGAFSRCYKLTDMSTSAVFALKVVPRGGAGRLRLRGKSLAHVLKVRRTLTEPEVRYYLRGLVSGLRYLHQQRIVHRDLKPSNFFLNKNMEVKIGDLGLAARVGPTGRCHRVLCGTPNFQAPEVVSRNGHSCKSDIWALGCIMYTVLTGTPPFAVAPLSEMYQNIRDGHYLEPTQLSPSARSLIARLLAPDPAERPSLDQLLQDDFFSQGFTPERLPPHSCHTPPVFAFPPPLGRLFRKVAQLLLTQCRPPCPFTSKEASDPEEGTELDHMETGSEEGGALCTEGQIHLLTLGTPPTGLTDPNGSLALQLEVTTRKLFLCLDAGPVGRTATPKSAQDPPRGAAACSLGSQVGGLLPQVWLWLPAVGWGQWRAVSGWLPHGPAPPRREGTVPMSATPASPDVCLLSVVADSRAMVMLFSNGTVQVSLKTSQTQLVLSGEGGDFLLTLQEPGGPGMGISYTLDVLRSHGLTLEVRQHLRHALHLLQSV